MGKFDCVRCGCEMVYDMKARFQLGQHSLVFGVLPHLLAGSIELELYRCPKCRKVEFYAPEENATALPQMKCPHCGTTHDFDYPKCPHCGHNYYEK